ncbi:hypothetical protein [Litorivivens sp.]|uniref:hypothetical protein n=1 Tax=Litorivivens sp. TaxID=2020868 RepID=UPI00356760E0
MKSRYTNQHGAVLVIVLIMVGIFMVIVTSLVASSSINFRIAGNQQYRMEAKLAARNALESYISNPANFALPLPQGNTVFNFNFSGKIDKQSGEALTEMSAIVSPPTCTMSNPIGINELDTTKKEDVQCMGSARTTPGIIGSSGATGNSDSWCTRMNWDVDAEVADTATGVEMDMTQGLSTRAVIGTPCPS